MKKIFVALTLLVFLFGCTLPGGTDNKNPSIKQGFGGTSGLSMSFVEDAPQKEISRDRPLSFALNVKSKGTFTVPSGSFMARLVGLDNNFNPNELSGTNSNALNAVDESGVGGEANVDLGKTSYNPEQMFSDRVIKAGDLQVEVCYPYETRVVTGNFWIGAKTSDVSKGSIAQSDNSNAPVQVMELAERGGGTYTDFDFKIKVVGSGSVVSTCFPPTGSLPTDDSRKRNVDLKILDRGASCYYEDGGERKDIGNSGTVVLNNVNEKIVHCKMDFSGEKPIKSQLQMQLNYLYLDKVSVPAITITRV